MNAIAQSSPAPESGPKLDSRRLVAGLIDLAVVLAPSFLIGFAAGLSGSELKDPGLTLGAVMAGWALYYYFALESGGGQTLGKKAMKLRVVRVDGRPLEMGDVAIRTVLRLVDGLFGYLVGLVVMLATGQRRARLGDLAAKTMIVSADVPQAGPPPPPAADAPERPEGAEVAPMAPPSPVEAPQAPAVVVETPLVVEPSLEEEPPVADEQDSVVEDEPPVVEEQPSVLVEPSVLAERLVVEEQLSALVEPSVAEEEPPVADEPPAVEQPPVVAAPPPPPAPEAGEPPADDDEPQITVRSVETVSAIDLVMGGDHPYDDEPQAPRES